MATSLLRIPPPRVLLRPLAVPERLLLGPGPSNVPPRILAAGGRQLLGHMHPEVLQVSCPCPTFFPSSPLPPMSCWDCFAGMKLAIVVPVGPCCHR